METIDSTMEGSDVKHEKNTQTSTTEPPTTATTAATTTTTTSQQTAVTSRTDRNHVTTQISPPSSLSQNTQDFVRVEKKNQVRVIFIRSFLTFFLH